MGDAQNTSQPPELSVVVLAYRSADTIANFVKGLSELLDQEEPHWEIILVGNFLKDSGDETPRVVQQIAETHPRIQAITKVKKGMMGWDMQSGLSAATGRHIAVIDGDNQMPYEDVPRVYRKLKDEQLDLVKTYRVQRYDGPYRVLISKVYNALFKFLFPGMLSRDINSKPKIMTREVYKLMNLKSNGWFIDAEIMIQARRLRLHLGEMETVFHSIHNRPSFVKPAAILEFFLNLLWFRLLEFQFWFRPVKPCIRWWKPHERSHEPAPHRSLRQSRPTPGPGTCWPTRNPAPHFNPSQTVGPGRVHGTVRGPARPCIPKHRTGRD